MKKIGNTKLTSCLSKALLLLVVFITQLGFSQKEFVVSASVLKDTVGYYDVVTVRFECNNNEASFREPVFADFKSYKTSTATEIKIVNGEMTSKEVKIFILKPNKPGKLTIESAVFTLNEKEYKTNPIEIFVKGLTIENDPLKKENKMFIIAEISNYEPYKFQPIMVDYKLYYEDGFKPKGFEFDFTPEYSSQFLLYALTTKDSVFKEKFNNKEYNCMSIRKNALRFKELYNTFIDAKVSVNYEEDLIKDGNQTIKKTTTKIFPIISERIKVKQFYTNLTFTKEIKSFGDYKLDVVVPEKSKYRKNKIFEIVIQLYGDGFLEDAMIPEMYIHEAFETISNTLKNERTLENGKVKSVATRTYKIKGIHEGTYTFYPTGFYFYNDKTDKKIALSSKEFTLQVK